MLFLVGPGLVLGPVPERERVLAPVLVQVLVQVLAQVLAQVLVQALEPGLVSHRQR